MWKEKLKEFVIKWKTEFRDLKDSWPGGVIGNQRSFSGEENNINRTKPEAIHQNNGRITPKTLPRLPVPLLTSQAQECQMPEERNYVKGGLGHWGLWGSRTTATSILCSLHSGAALLGQPKHSSRGPIFSLSPNFRRNKQQILTAFTRYWICRSTEELWGHGFLYLDRPGTGVELLDKVPSRGKREPYNYKHIRLAMQSCRH